MTPHHRSSKINIPKGTSAMDIVLQLPFIFPRLAFLQVEIYSPQDGSERRIAKACLTSTKAKAKESVHHNAKKNRKIKLSVKGLTARIPKLISQLPDSDALGINSICWLRDGTVRHIPMMDFKPKPSPANRRLIQQSLAEIGQSGLLVQSGRSFHFYGLALLREKDWLKFLGDSLLVKFSDSRWIGHSLLEQRCNLRFTTSKLRRKDPVVRAFVVNTKGASSRNRR
jgi:hypothetical protein